MATINSNYPKIWPYNATAVEGEDPFALGYLYLIIMVAFVANAVMSYWTWKIIGRTGWWSGEQTLKIRRYRLVSQYAWGFVPIFVIYVIGLAQYRNRLLTNVTHSYAYLPQDVWLITMSALSLGSLGSYMVAQLARPTAFISKTNEASQFFSGILPRVMLLTQILFTGSYAYSTMSAYFPNTATYGPLLGTFMGTSFVLAGVLMTQFMIIFYRTSKWKLFMTGNTPLTKVLSADLFETSGYVFYNSVAVEDVRVQGEVELMDLSIPYIVGLCLFFFLGSFIFYGDQIKPYIFAFVVLVPPVMIAAQAKRTGFFIPFFNWFLVTYTALAYIGGYITPPPVQDAADYAAHWQQSINWNILLTGPDYTTVSAAGTSMQFLYVATAIAAGLSCVSLYQFGNQKQD